MTTDDATTTDQPDEQTTGGTQAPDDTTDAPAGDQDGQDGTDADDGDTFPRAYVEKLRKESADYRTRAQRADDLAKRLHTSLVAATGRLADPTDLPYDEAHLDDPDALTAALDDLLATKPHLASRKPMFGDIGQGETGGSADVSLLDIMRANAL